MYELRRILVPTDFSRHADEALEYVLYLGGQFHPEVVLLHVDACRYRPSWKAMCTMRSWSSTSNARRPI